MIAPVAAPLHATLALWTFSDTRYTAAKPIWGTSRSPISVSSATWPLAVAFACCVASLLALRSTPQKPRPRSDDALKATDSPARPRLYVNTSRKFSLTDQTLDVSSDEEGCEDDDQATAAIDALEEDDDEDDEQRRRRRTARGDAGAVLDADCASSNCTSSTASSCDDRRDAARAQTPAATTDLPNSCEPSAASASSSSRDARRVSKHLPWPAALRYFECHGIAHSYEHEDAHKLKEMRTLRTRASVFSRSGGTLLELVEARQGSSDAACSNLNATFEPILENEAEP